MIQYCDIFVEVRQRVAAFKYWNEYLGCSDSYGNDTEEEYLDAAYRFLFTSASKRFIEFCAKKEEMWLGEYCYMLGIKESDLIE
jgi:hypothetical protein